MENYACILSNIIEKHCSILHWKRLGIVGNPKHTPHDCRHTFSALCEKYGVRENDRKRMLGHSFGGDVTNAVYGHRTLEELRDEIEKIKVPFVTNCD